MIHTFTVTLDAECNETTAREYVRDAVRCWGGQFTPEDPLFGLKESDVEVVARHADKSRTARERMSLAAKATWKRRKAAKLAQRPTVPEFMGAS